MSLLAVAACAVAAALAYSNSLHNAFALDDGHSIESNPWVRNIANVPAFFRDASTFSTLRANVDYRPFLQTTYTVNHAWSGYETWSWHLTNLSLHVIVATSLFFLGRRLFGSLALAPLPGLPTPLADTAAFVAALLFAVHPVGTGCVNYISARSSSLVAALALPALVAYLGAIAEAPAPRRLGLAIALYVLAVLTKVEAVSFLPVLVLAEILLAPSRHDLPLSRRLLRAATQPRLAPFVAITVVYLLLWRSMSSLAASPTLASSDVTPFAYFLTQLRAWWHYVGIALAPTHLVADDPTFPVSRALTEPLVMLAAAGWLGVATAAALTAKRAPAVAFLLASFVLFLLPHSSFVPLAEPVNEHRPYLPLSFLFLLMSMFTARALASMARRPAVTLAALALLLAVPLVALTRERNAVWRDDLTLWGDTVRKVPDSTRAQMNYGLALMARGRTADAEERFREAVRLAPSYAHAWTNLGISLAARGQDGDARRAFDRAVELAPYADAPYYWRARFRAARADDDGALSDLERAASNSSTPFRELAGLAELHAWRGDDAAASAATERGLALDASTFESERTAFRKVALAARRDRALVIVNDGVDVMRRGDFRTAESHFREALRLDGSSHLAWTNLGIVRIAQGDVARGRSALDRAVQVGSTDPSPWLWRGRTRAETGDLDGAIEDLRRAAAMTPTSATTLAVLAASLDRLGRLAESTEVADRGRHLDAGAFDREHAAFLARIDQAQDSPGRVDTPSGRS